MVKLKFNICDITRNFDKIKRELMFVNNNKVNLN